MLYFLLKCDEFIRILEHFSSFLERQRFRGFPTCLCTNVLDSEILGFGFSSKHALLLGIKSSSLWFPHQYANSLLGFGKFS